MDNRENALDFVRHFAAGRLDELEPLLSEDLKLAGPYLTVNSRADYLEALRNDPPEACDYNVLSVTSEDDTVVVIWDYEKEETTLTISQLFRFVDNLISEIRLVFDSGQSAKPAYAAGGRFLLGTRFV